MEDTNDYDIKSKSKITQAIKLFSEFKSPIDVIIALDLPANQVREIYQEFWELQDMHILAQTYEEAEYDLHDLLGLHRIAKLLGLKKRDIISAFELIKYNELETLQWKAGYLRSEINTLECVRYAATGLFDVYTSIVLLASIPLLLSSIPALKVVVRSSSSSTINILFKNRCSSFMTAG